jgi:hypothetical protein
MLFMLLSNIVINLNNSISAHNSIIEENHKIIQFYEVLF